MLGKTERLINEKPELFDYQDIPPEPPAAYSKQIDDTMPKWLKDLIAEVKAKDEQLNLAI